MNTTPIIYPIPEPLKAYFKQEFFYLLKSYAAHDVMFHAVCHQLSKEVDAIGWSLDRRLVWIMSHFNVKPEDAADNVVFLQKIMSRKKQVIPMLSALWG